jgi:hypothetical protein
MSESDSEAPPVSKSLPISEPSLAVRPPAELVARDDEPPSSIRMAAQASVIPPDPNAPPRSSRKPHADPAK